MAPSMANEDRILAGRRRQPASRSAAILTASLVTICGSVHADDLSGDTLRETVEGITWAAEDGWGFWKWQTNNELCVMTYSPDEECTDSGPWAIEDDALCYELEWWGEAYGLRKNCFVVRSLDDGRYDAVPKDSAVDSAVFAFSLAK